MILKHPIYVVYASATGNAENCALNIVRRLRISNIHCKLLILNDFWKEFKNTLQNDDHQFITIYVVSTTGQGEIPINMRIFWRSILNIYLPLTFFSHLNFTIFGLGDSRYPQFNVTARKLLTRLKQLGGKEFFRLGLGDEQHDFGYEGEFDPWFTKMLESLSNKFGICTMLPPSVLNTNPNGLYVIPSDFIIEYVKDDNISNDTEKTKFQVPYGTMESQNPLITGKVISNTRLTSQDHFQDVRQLQLELPPETYYAAGDALSIYPCLNKHHILTFIHETLGLNDQQKVHITLSPDSCLVYNPFNTTQPITLFDVFSRFFNLDAIPDRYFFQVLAYYTTNELHKNKLIELSGNSLESKDAYYEYCKSERRSISEVLWDFHDVGRQIPLPILFSIIPILHPRFYSCASAHQWYSTTLWKMTQIDTHSTSPIMWWNQYIPLLYTKQYQKKPSLLRRLLFKFFGDPSILQLKKKNILLRIMKQWCIDQWNENKGYPYYQKESVIVDLCVAVVEYKTKLQRHIVGTCSRYLKELKPGDIVPLRVEPGAAFGSLPSTQINDLASLLLICPGTGVAPCRALVQQRYIQWIISECKLRYQYELMNNNETIKIKKSLNRSLPRIIIALGVRHPYKDFLFYNNWEHFWGLSTWRPWNLPLNCLKESSSAFRSTIAKYCYQWNFAPLIAFSQYPKNSKVYVQEILQEYAETIQHVAMLPNSVVVISGRSHPMPSQVIQALQDIMTTKDGMTHDEAVTFWNEKKKKRELLLDTWG